MAILAHIAPFFTEDAVYAIGDDRAEGHDAVLAQLKQGVDSFDRLMSSRVLTLNDITVDGNEVVSNWTVTYTLEGCPDISIHGTETARFEGEQIASLVETFDPESQAALGEWMGAHGARLVG